MNRTKALWGLMALAMILTVSACSRDSWDITFPEEGTNHAEFSFSLNANAAGDGDPVYINGSVVPGYADDPTVLVPFGTFESGSVNGTFSRNVWGNETFTAVFWRKELATGRYFRLTDIEVNGMPLLAVAATEWDIHRMFQLYVEDGEVMVDRMASVDSLMTAHIWYTGDTLTDDLNDPADPDEPVYWLGTWTTFRYPRHATTWSNGRWTTDFTVAKEAMLLLRLEAEDGDELRSGVFVGSGSFNDALEAKCMRDLGGGYYAFEIGVDGDGDFYNPRTADERYFGIEIGGN
ncbi:MAG: hypothetical protein Q8Q20_04770 [bacterium]|nr:hypothetical protein [bacterium]